MAIRRTKRKKRETEADGDDSKMLDALAKDLDTYSATISTQVRTIALGVLGLSWAMLLGGQSVDAVASKLPRPWVIGISGACLIALLLDLFQYLLDYKATAAAYDKAAKVDGNDEDTTVDDQSFAYRAAFFCYRAKLLLAIGAATVLFGLIAYVLI